MPDWVKFRPSEYLAITRSMKPSQKARFMDDVADALVWGKRGVHEWADRMMDEAEDSLSKRREAGRLGGRRRSSNAQAMPSNAQAMPSNAQAMPSNAQAMPSNAQAIHTDIQTDRQTDKENPLLGVKESEPRQVATKPDESPEEEARRLGFERYATVAAELRKIVPAVIPIASVYMAADGQGFDGEELLKLAHTFNKNHWHTSQGHGVLIGSDNIGSVIATWAMNRNNFERKENDGSKSNRRSNQVFDTSRPLNVQRGQGLDVGDLPF